MSRLLVADDDRVVLFTLAEGLRQNGFEVLEARDGLQALDICKTDAPDLALLDIRMPGLDGLQLARRMVDETDVPFMFFSAHGDLDYVERAVRLGALGYLLKPLPVASIVPTLRAALARAQDLTGLKAALARSRNIGMAVGILMRETGLNQHKAFERLRQDARNQRSKVEDAARRLVHKSEQNTG